MLADSSSVGWMAFRGTRRPRPRPVPPRATAVDVEDRGRHGDAGECAPSVVPAHGHACLHICAEEGCSSLLRVVSRCGCSSGVHEV